MSLKDRPDKAQTLQELDRWIEAAGDESFFVLKWDVDGFFKYFKKYGVEESQRVFEEIAKELESLLRESEFLGWLEGDEFLLLSKRNRDSIKTLIGEIQKRMKARTFQVGSEEVPLSLSIGVCEFPHDGRFVRDLIKNLSIAISESKENGPGGYLFFRED